MNDTENEVQVRAEKLKALMTSLLKSGQFQMAAGIIIYNLVMMNEEQKQEVDKIKKLLTSLAELDTMHMAKLSKDAVSGVIESLAEGGFDVRSYINVTH